MSATMEYLGRLGLVPTRKSKKDRDSSPHRISCSEESRGLKADLTRVIESGLTSTSTIAIARLVDYNTTTTTTTSGGGKFIPRRQDDDDDEMEYMEYAKHVQEQARARFGAPGGRHAWKTLIFWKKRRRTSTTSVTTSAASSASTPMSHHHHAVPVVATPLRKVGRCKSAAATLAAPLYCSDGHSLESTMSIRAWYEPMLRGGKLVALHQQDQQQDFCNRSPYVPLGTGRRTPRFASPGPLYLV